VKVIIKEVTDKRLLKKFIKFPNRLYKGNRFYVPQFIASEFSTLSKAKNPAFEFCDARYWLAYDERSTIVGRIAGIINHRYNQKTATNYVRFGWLDFVEDLDVLKALFDTVESWARANGAQYLHGPLGFSEFDASGILVEGFNELPTAYGKYNYPYYQSMVEQLGFEKEVDWVEYNIKVPGFVPEKYSKMADIIEERYQLHRLKFSSKRELLAYTDEIFQLLNREYSGIHGFAELTQGQIDDLKKQFIPLIQLKFVSVVKNAQGEMVGFGICLPSLSKAIQKSKGRMFPFGFIYFLKALKYNDTLDTLLIAIHDDYKNKGVNALIFNDIGKAIVESGITNIETTRELEDNFMVQNLWNKLDYRQHKRARCYIKKLSS
jgi:hypothetical protein